jgi:hypothetical protein
VLGGGTAVGSAVAARAPSGAKVCATAPCAGAAAGAPPATWDHVTVIMFENKPLKKIIGNTADAPYINSIANACSYSKNTLALSAVSLANYVALTSGYTGCHVADANGVCTTEREITENRDPNVWPQASKSLFEVMNTAAPGSAKQWGESQPSNCSLSSDRNNNFTVTHTPFQYYTRTRTTLCPQYALPFPANSVDVISAKYNLVIPNKKNIMHLVPNTTIAQRIRNGDNWLAGYLPSLLNSPAYQAGRTAIIITWDEGNARNFYVPLIVVTPYTTVGGVSNVAYDHYSTLKGVQQMVGATPLLGHAGDAGKSSIRDDAIFRLK